MTLFKKNIILIIMIVLIIVAPLILVGDAEFSGADGLAEEEILKIDPSYEPWYSSWFEPASGEIESLLFCLQAAIGAGIVGFTLGRITSKNSKESEDC